MYPLNLMVNPDNWLLFLRRRGDPSFSRLRDRVLERDRYTCQYCGFQAYQHQETVNIDHDYRNNNYNNIITSCVFCAQCGFLEAIGDSGFGGGRLVYIPEMTQVELNSLCHVLFCAMANGTSYRESAQEIYRNLKLRSQPIENKFGAGSSRPSYFGQMLIEFESNDESMNDKALSNFHLLPSYPKFKKELADWARAAEEELSSADKTSG